VSCVCTFYVHTVGIFVLLAHQVLLGRHAPVSVWGPIHPDRSLGSVADARRRLHRALDLCLQPTAATAPGRVLIPQPTPGAIVDALIEMAGSGWLFLCAGVLAVVGLVALLVAALRSSRLPPTAELSPIAALVLLTIWSLTPIALPWLVSFVLVPIFIPRVAIASLAPLTILVALGVTVIRPRLAGTVIGLMLLSASTVGVVKWEGRTTKENWRDLTRHVEATAQPGDLLLLHQAGRREGLQHSPRRTDLLLVGFPERRFPAGEFVRPDLPPWPR
jgi:hypothetical protein